MEGKPLVTLKQKTVVVCDVPTQVVCTAFSSHILVVVTQFGETDTLVSLEPSNTTSDISKPVLATKVLPGQDKPLIQVFAKNLVAFVSQEAGNRAVLLAVAVKDRSMEGVTALKEAIRTCQVVLWTCQQPLLLPIRTKWNSDTFLSIWRPSFSQKEEHSQVVALETGRNLHISGRLCFGG
uniref:Proteasome assembly chaperone 3 n=1 Tax=Catagonus wagneri TaxID=51154 RepID=A0A8C3X2F3_9CETA